MTILRRYRPPMARIGRRFLSRPADELARALLGVRLVRITPGAERLSGIIVETEAYLGEIDRASHTFGGRRTARTEPMYDRPGTAYVYFTYGMHHCMNVAAGKVDLPHAVLIRALEPVEGLDTMRRNRAGKGPPDALARRDLCSGPGKLCQALEIDRALSGIDLCEHEDLFLERGRAISDDHIASDRRIGIGDRGEWTEKPLRWLVLGNQHVSCGVRAHDSAHRA